MDGKLNSKNFNTQLGKLKYWLLKPLNYLNRIELKDDKIWKSPFLKKFQYERFITILKKKNCTKILEFGSGNSTIYILKGYRNYELFQSVNPKEEENYTDLVRKEINKRNLNNKYFNILNVNCEKKYIDQNNTINFNFNFEDMYDIIYIDGPNKKLTYNTSLIHNLLINEIKSKIYFFDGRHYIIDIFIDILKKNNIKYFFEHSQLLNYSIIEIDD